MGHTVKSMLRLEFMPAATSRTWRKSSLTMHMEARGNLETEIAPALARQENWHAWRIVEEAV